MISITSECPGNSWHLQVRDFGLAPRPLCSGFLNVDLRYVVQKRWHGLQ